MNRQQDGFTDFAAQPYPWEETIEFFDRLYGTDYASQVY
jgi:hypothetical protein